MAEMALSPWQGFAAAAIHRPFLLVLALRLYIGMHGISRLWQRFFGIQRQLCKQCVRSLQTPWILGFGLVEVDSVADSLLCCYAN